MYRPYRLELASPPPPSPLSTWRSYRSSPRPTQTNPKDSLYLKACPLMMSPILLLYYMHDLVPNPPAMRDPPSLSIYPPLE